MNPDSAVIERGIETICLEVLNGNQKGEKKEFSSSDVIKIGRGMDSRLQILDPSASKKHALLKKGFLDHVYLEDKQSRNGTFVNEERITKKYALQNGDIIRIGYTEIRYSYISRNQ